MKLPRRRGSRTYARTRLALTGDFDDTGETIGELIDKVRPADYNGRTWEHPDWPHRDVIPPGVVAVKQPGRDTHPLAFRGAPVPVRPALPPAAPAPLAITAAPATRAEEALTWLQLKVKALAKPDRRTGQNKLDRIAEDKLKAMAARRRDGLRQPRDTAYLIVAEAAEALRAGREPWDPGPEPPIPWYRPEAGDDGMPIPRREPWYPDGAA